MGRILFQAVYVALLGISLGDNGTTEDYTVSVGSSHTQWPLLGKCSVNEFQCANGECIPQDKRCDAATDCSDSSDEHGCCLDKDRYFSCRSGDRCIHNSLRCDQFNDCPDGSDEDECSLRPRDCNKHSITCDNGTMCVPKAWLCDRHADCKDGSDEQNCKDLTCQPHNFQCNNSACVPPKFVCDGEDDCQDGSDELGCDTVENCDASTRRMKCATKLQCVSLEVACDNKPDCVDGSDEGGDCILKTTMCDNYCSHECYKTPNGAVCVCPPFYQLNLDGRTCSDIDECRSNWSVCGQFCNNQDGGYTCTCAKGYALQKDNKTCLTTIPGRPFLILAIGNGVRLFYLDIRMYDVLYQGKEQVFGVSYDPVDDVVYWHSKRSVYRKGRRSDGLAEVILAGVGEIGGLAVDWYGRNIYLADKDDHTIHVCSLDGVTCLPLVVVSTGIPCALQIDPFSRYLFWTDTGVQQIERAGLDGSDRKVLVKRDFGWPNALALDTPAQRVYWFDVKNNTAEHVDYEGRNLKHLPEAAIEQPHAMSIWEDMVYWSDLHKQAIMAANKRTGKNQTEFIKLDNKKAYGIFVYHPALNMQVLNPCSASDCSHLCLLSPQTWKGFTCACPRGMTLQSGRICRGLVTQNLLLLGIGPRLHAFQQRDYGGSHVVEWQSNVLLERGTDMEYDPVRGRIIISDVWANQIVSIDLQTRVTTTLIDNVPDPVGVAVDWLLGNIYWVDGIKHIVEATNSSGQQRSIIVPNIYHPEDIAVAPIEGYLFVTVGGINAYITRCRLDGNDCVKILTRNDVQKPRAIVVDNDPSNRRIYWADSWTNKICSANFDGTSMTDVVGNLDFPVDIAIAGNTIFWSQRHSSNLYSTTKLGYASNVTRYSIGEENRESLVSAWAFALVDISWKFSPQDHNASNPCEVANGGCEHLCFVNADRDKVCKCSVGYELGNDGVSCRKESKCNDYEYKCVSNGLCISKFWKCDGFPDCDDKSDESDCSQCDKDEFRCGGGECIKESWKCDKFLDCSDGSDESEEICGPQTCPPMQWQCASLQCIPKSWVCDGAKDCKDSSDEANCSQECPEGKFNCGNGLCINMKWRCDGGKDCMDGRDEEDCGTKSCPPDHFTCANGHCIPKSLQCDGADACGDNSDEDERSNCTISDCPPHTFRCTHLAGERLPICLPHSSLCDGIADCVDSEDEKNCSLNCSQNEFRCPNSSRCIPNRWVCNGVADCKGGEDEDKHCNKTTTKPVTVKIQSCADSEFECSDGDCVPYVKTCDNITDCLDGSDEAGNCLTSCINNGGCQQICRPGPIFPRCECEDGYMRVENYCWDENECEMESTCSHHCINLRGSFKCYCAPGYLLEPDMRTCKPENGHDSLLIVDEEEILILSNEGRTWTKDKMASNNEFDLSSVSSVDVDPVGGLIVMADVASGTITLHQIQTANQTGNDVLPLDYGEVKVLFRNLERPNAVSLDYENNNIYFSQLRRNSNRRQRRSYSQVTIMKVCSLVTRRCHSLYRAYNVTIPVSRVSMQARKLFMCENSMQDSAKILTSRLDGKDIRALVSDRMVRCGDIALDEVKQRVYWIDSKLNVIEMVSWEGSRRRRVRETMVYNPVGLGILEDKLLWYNRDKRELVTCHRFDPETSNCSFIELGRAPVALATKPAVTYHAEIDVCKELKCEQLCVPLPEGQAGAARCLCEAGFVAWSENQTVCVLAGVCKDDTCGQDGDCVTMGKDGYMCKCHDGFSGIACEVQSKPARHGWGATTLAVILVLIFVGLFSMAVLWWKRGGLQLWRKNNLASNLQFRFANPSFGLMDERAAANASQPPSPTGNPFNNPTSNNLPQKNVSLPDVEHGFENKGFKEIPDIDNSPVVDLPPPTSVANENLSPYQPGPNYVK